MKAFIVCACLIALTSGLPSKLGRAGRQQGGYFAPRAPQAEYGSVAQESQLVVDSRAAPRAAPIATLRSFQDADETSFRYNFATENEIEQSAEGELRTVGDADVMVMRGSYSYVGPDGNTYVVEWYADETGFHPSAPHLPQSVEPNHPEVAAAVEAQLRFAAEEEAAAAASSRSNSYAAPVAAASSRSSSSYDAPAVERLAGYTF